MKAQVLIVDDSATVRMDLRGVLGAAGFATTLCDSLDSARRALAQRQFDLVILDMVLPDGNGVDLLVELRNTEQTARTPVLMLSTEAAVAHRLRGLVNGADDYVGKPYDSAYVVKRACELTQVMESQGEPRLVAAARRRKVMVVDDSSTFRHSIFEELLKDGHDTILAESGEEALQLLQAQPVDCILMDLVMPGMNGIEVVRTLRALPTVARTPVLMLTSRFEGRVMAEALAAGADAFHQKTEDLELLRVQVRNLLRRRMSEAESAAAAAPPAPPSGRTESLFEQVVARSGLSPVIAPSTVERACRRAGVDARHLTPADLERALLALRDTLRLFLSEEETTQRIAAIAELTRGTEEEHRRETGSASGQRIR